MNLCTDIVFQPRLTRAAHSAQAVEELQSALDLAAFDWEKLESAYGQLAAATASWSPIDPTILYRADVESLLIRAAEVRQATHMFVEMLRLTLECWENAEYVRHFDVGAYLHPENTRTAPKSPAESLKEN